MAPRENQLREFILFVRASLLVRNGIRHRHLHNWRSEFRKYHRDEKGKIVKANDHLMDATRYLVVSGRDYMRVTPKPVELAQFPPASPGGWMAG